MKVGPPSDDFYPLMSGLADGRPRRDVGAVPRRFGNEPAGGDGGDVDEHARAWTWAAARPKGSEMKDAAPQTSGKPAESMKGMDMPGTGKPPARPEGPVTGHEANRRDKESSS